MEDVFLYSKALMRQDAPAPQLERLSPISVAGIQPACHMTPPQAATPLHASCHLWHDAHRLVIVRPELYYYIRCVANDPK